MLKGKRILLVGGLDETGKAVLDQLVECGAEVVIVDESREEDGDAVDPKHSTVSFVEGNLTDADQLSADLAESIANIPILDGVVFAAGIGGVRPLSLSKPVKVREMLEANCVCFIEVVRFLLKKKKLAEGSSIVAVSSVSSIMGLKSKLAYAISKAALNAAVRNIAAEVASRQIRVNTILKGPMTIDFELEHINNLSQLGSEVNAASGLGNSTPKDLGNLVSFLLSDMVLTITGAEIKLDGGYSL